MAMFDHTIQNADLYRPVTNGIIKRWTAHYKITEIVGKNKKVLDIGCGAGYLAKRLKQRGNYIVGIEIDEGAAKIAEAICDEIIVANIENLDILPYPSEFFDVILFSDVLEHLVRPDLILMKIHHYLKRDGIVVACIPNIAWLIIRIKLLFGKFNYEESGHFDKGHLRFFTLSSTKYLFKSSGYKICMIKAIGLNIIPSLLALRFIIVAKQTT